MRRRAVWIEAKVAMHHQRIVAIFWVWWIRKSRLFLAGGRWNLQVFSAQLIGRKHVTAQQNRVKDN